MTSVQLSGRRKACLFGLRAATIAISAAALGIFVSILEKRAARAARGAHIDITWTILPVAALGCSLAWNLFSVLCLITGSQYYLPRSFHLGAECLTAVGVVVCGYMSFIYDLIHYHRMWSRRRGHAQRDLEIAGVVLFSVACTLHLGFFLQGVLRIGEKRKAQAETAPPQYAASADVFDDARSLRSLPEYAADGYEIGSLDKKEAAISVEEV